MPTVEHIAQQIDQLKPDLASFNQILVDDEQSVLLDNIQSTSSIYVKLLKAEIATMYIRTHPRRYFAVELRIALQDILQSGVSGLSSIPSTSGGTYFPMSYAIRTKFDPARHISAHVTDIKRYLPKYLWNKVCIKQSSSELKQLNPDEFNFAVFKAYLEQLPKGLSSADVERYFDQINSFNLSIRQKFLELILDNCPKPSIKLQKNEYNQMIPKVRTMDTEVHKYMELPRYLIRNLADTYNIPVAAAVHDCEDSYYKPFITNLPRTPTLDRHNLTYLVNAVMVLQFVTTVAPNPLFKHCINALVEHLKHPDYAKPLAEYLNTMSNMAHIASGLESIFKD